MAVREHGAPLVSTFHTDPRVTVPPCSCTIDIVMTYMSMYLNCDFMTLLREEGCTVLLVAARGV